MADEELIKVPKKDWEAFKAFMKKSKGKIESGVDTDEGFKLGGGALDIFKEGELLYKANRDAIKNTGLLLRDLSGPEGFIRKFALMAEGSVGIFDSIRPGVEAVTALGESMRTFAMTQKDTQGEMATTAAVFKKLGVETSDMASVMDSARLGFGKTGEDALALARSIGAVGNATGVGMGKAMKNFRSAQSSMAYDSKKLMENFKQLQFSAAVTGVSFDKLTGAFGDSMDSFGGSAKKAGDLNAILGRSVFNSIDLLGQSEGERVKTIVQGIRESVNVEALSKNKFQLKAVAKGLGLSPDETRKLLKGHTTVDDVLAGKAPKDEREAALSRMSTLLNQSDGVNEGLSTFVKILKESRDIFSNAIPAVNKAQRKVIQTLLSEFGMGTNATPGALYQKFNEGLGNLSPDKARQKATEAKDAVKSLIADKSFMEAFATKKLTAAQKKTFESVKKIFEYNSGTADPTGAESPAEKARKAKMIKAETKAQIIESVKAEKKTIVEGIMEALSGMAVNVDGKAIANLVPTPGGK